MAHPNSQYSDDDQLSASSNLEVGLDVDHATQIVAKWHSDNKFDAVLIDKSEDGTIVDTHTIKSGISGGTTFRKVVDLAGDKAVVRLVEASGSQSDAWVMAKTRTGRRGQ